MYNGGDRRLPGMSVRLCRNKLDAPGFQPSQLVKIKASLSLPPTVHWLDYIRTRKLTHLQYKLEEDSVVLPSRPGNDI
jgi:hypothetical protein